MENSKSSSENVKEITFIKGFKSINFHKLKKPQLPSNCKILGNKTSLLTKAFAEMGIAKEMSSGLYKATVNAADLSKYSDGTVSSIVKVNGKISEHAGFVEAGMGVFTPTLVFQALSMITGQYYLNGITGQLNHINSKLDYLIKLDESDTFGKLGAFNDTLTNMSQQNYFNLEDFIKIEDNIQELNTISKKYFSINLKFFEKSSKINLDEEKESRAQRGFFKRNAENTSSKIGNFIDDFTNERITNNVLFYVLADNLLKQYLVLRVKANLKVQDPDVNRLGKIRELTQNIENLKSFDLDKTSERIHILKEKVQPYLKLLLEDVNSFNYFNVGDKIDKFNNEVEYLKQKINEEKNTTSYLQSKFKQDANIYIAIDENGEQIYLENY